MIRGIKRVELTIVCERCGRKAQVESLDDTVCLSCLAFADRRKKVGKVISRVVSDAAKGKFSPKVTP